MLLQDNSIVAGIKIIESPYLDKENIYFMENQQTIVCHPEMVQKIRFAIKEKNKMSDAVRCPRCGYVYWSAWNENWGSCTNCNINNDFFKDDEPRIVDSDKIHTFIPSEDVPEDVPEEDIQKEKRFNRYTALKRDEK